MTKKIVYTAIVASLYAALALVLMPFSFGPVQLRIAEVLCIMPLFMIEGVWGLTIGCFIANLFSPFGAYDFVFGTLITLVSAILTRKMRKIPFLAILPPIILNAFLLPIIWKFVGGEPAYWLNVGTTIASQSIAILVIGLPLYYALKKPFNKLYKLY